MWLLIFIFLIITLLVGWFLFGYFAFIWFQGLFRNKKLPEIPASLPVISLLIPCFNEEKQILLKLENVRGLDYPKELLEVFFIDGKSTDKTLDLLSKSIGKDEPYKIIECPEAGKISQLNYCLPYTKGKIIINSDVDALLATDALKWIIAEFNVSEDISVVGAYCRPVDNLEVEKYYWFSQNKGRLLESDAYSSSIVLAQCYAFRRGFLKTFPEDVVADDVYIAYLAHAKNVRVIYSRKATVVETRFPRSYSEFLPHKFRKSNAFLRESLRFLYLLPEMNTFCKTMFLTRIAQQLILPWALLFWFFLLGMLLTMFRYDIVALSLVLLLIIFAFTYRVFHSIKMPDGDQKFPFTTLVRGYILTIAVMLATGVAYPFFKQNSTYSRLKD
jgi:cellulose synthase/poly-beta-1,6-N-acetylglucosamine synthase-like glycosyltransferase